MKIFKLNDKLVGRLLNMLQGYGFKYLDAIFTRDIA